MFLVKYSITRWCCRWFCKKKTIDYTKTKYNNLPFGFFDVGTSVIIDEIIVVSGWSLYESSGSFVHNVKAIWDLSNWYLLIKSFGDNLSSWIISKFNE